MKKLLLKTLIVDDNDFECPDRNKKITFDDINIHTLSFKDSDIKSFSLILYKGKFGTKIIKIEGT